MNQDFIFINGQKINSNNLDNFSESWQGDSAIIEFLRAWWDTGDSIPAYTSGSTGKPKKIKLLRILEPGKNQNGFWLNLNIKLAIKSYKISNKSGWRLFNLL